MLQTDAPAPESTEQLVTPCAEPGRRLFRSLGPYRGRLAGALTSSLANKLLDLAPPVLIGFAVDVVAGIPPAWMVGLVGPEVLSLALLLGGLALGIFFFESVFQWLYRYLFLTLAQRVQHDLRRQAYAAMQRRELAFFEKHRLGETLAMLNDDVNQLERFLNTSLNDLVQLMGVYVIAGGILALTSGTLALIAFAPIPLVLAGALWFRRLLSPRYRVVRQAVGELSSRLENNLAGILVVKSFTAEPYEQGRVEAASARYRDANQRAIALTALFVPIIRMAIALGFGAILIVGVLWARSGRLTPGEFTLFAFMVQRILWPTTRIGNILDELERAKASARRVFGLIDTESTIMSPPDALPLGAARGALEFHDVTFGYGRGRPVLDGFTLSVAPGETVGIAGPTGAGKSTLVKLLLRLYDVDAGRITLDGHDLRALGLADLRRQIALVSQDVYLFHGTIAENIAYGQPSVDVARVAWAAELAHLSAFVQRLPARYETIVGERGIRLSGGQRQRLSLARAILKDAPILVLDEATSSVDTETERLIQASLASLTEGKTALVIAHRLSTITHADRIVVIEDGRVAEEGDHAALVARGGAYADLWAIQVGAATAPAVAVKTAVAARFGAFRPGL